MGAPNDEDRPAPRTGPHVDHLHPHDTAPAQEAQPADVPAAVCADRAMAAYADGYHDALVRVADLELAAPEVLEIVRAMLAAGGAT